MTKPYILIQSTPLLLPPQSLGIFPQMLAEAYLINRDPSNIQMETSLA